MEKVFQIDRNFEIILNPEAVKLVPELAMITQVELRYVILTVDYVSSPYRLKSLDERKAMAIKKIWKSAKKSVKDIETAKVRIAMREYEGLVFDMRRKTIDVYKDKINFLHRQTLTADITLTKLKDFTAQIDFLQTKINLLEKEINNEEESALELKGNKVLSYIEIWQRRQKEHRKFQQSMEE